jgi:4-hydroxybenzoate polyprenyltransferase
VFLRKVGRAIRIEQWWDYKLVPISSVFYATTYMQHVSIASVWVAAVALLFATAPCAAYVSLINDLTDRTDDRRAGKSNRMEGRPVWQITVLIAAPLFVAVAFSVLWKDNILLVGAYLGSWVAFSLYSVPPVRLKRRGALGVIADACGSHVFPTAVAALLVYRATGNAIDPVWIAALLGWALGCGLRGILWHQLYDFEADRKSEVNTFVLRYSQRAAVRLARVALVIELVGLVAILWQVNSPWPAIALLIYVVFAAVKSRMWNLAIVVAAPTDRYMILGQEYYTFLFPLGLLLSSALLFPEDWAVLIVHLMVFRLPAVSIVRQMRQLLRDLAQAQKQSRILDLSDGT